MLVLWRRNESLHHVNCVIRFCLSSDNSYMLIKSRLKTEPISVRAKLNAIFKLLESLNKLIIL